jgi:photosystem II stability/assembly factor-like uncharacterized protein
LTDKIGFAGLEAGTVYKTVDGGHTWSLSCNITNVLRHFFALDTTNIYMVLGDNLIVHSRDGGATWTEQQSPVIAGEMINDIYFLDSDHGLASASKSLPYTQLLTTSDGGNTWKQKFMQPAADLLAIHFFDQNNGIISASREASFVTTDGGKTWDYHKQQYGMWSGFDLVKVFYFDSDHAVAMGREGGMGRVTYILADTNLTTGIHGDPLENSEIKIFPNPAMGQIHLTLPSTEEPATLSVINSMGQVVSIKQLETEDQSSLTLESLSPGLYIIELKTGKSIWRGKSRSGIVVWMPTE